MRLLRLPELDPSPEATEVQADTWKYSKDGKLFLRGASSFAVAAAFNEDTNEGYMGHFWGQPLSCSESFSRFMAVLHEQQHGSRLGIWIGGVALLESPKINTETLEIYNDSVRQDMGSLAYAMLNLREISDDDIHTTWLGVNNEITVAQLDCTSGEIQYVVREIEPPEFELLSE